MTNFTIQAFLSTFNCVPKYITDLFLMEKSVELFRICIRNNFQALPHVFIARGYDLMKAMEDC